MKWFGRRQSGNVDDRRGISGGKLVVGGGIVGVIIYLAQLFLGGGDININDLQNILPAKQQEMTAEEKVADDQRAEFVKVVLADTEDVWDSIFAENGKKYMHPTLILFRDGTQSACGNATSASGPFYCPADNDVYIDLSFAEDLQNRFQASGDFALAYVVAHEVGHHIQFLLGVTDKMAKLREQLNETEYNKYSVKMELQADFYAGLWAHHAQRMKNILDEGDIAEALTAANAIGDDRLQKAAQGTVTPDAFTHGTSEQRMYWFKKGYDTGDITQGDTFLSNK